MVQSGRVTFGAMEAVVFGRPAAEVIGEEATRLGDGSNAARSE